MKLCFAEAILVLGLAVTVQGNCSVEEVWCKRLQRCMTLPSLGCNCTCESMKYLPSNETCVNSSVNSYNESLCVPEPRDNVWNTRISLKLKEIPECETESSKQTLRTGISKELQLEENHIRNMTVACANKTVSFLIISNNKTALNITTARLSKRIEAGKVSVKYDAKRISVISMQINGLLVTVASTASISLTTTRPIKTGLPLTINWRPILITVGAVVSTFVLFVCCSCAVHSYWLRKKIFTKYNSTPQRQLEKTRPEGQLEEYELEMQQKEVTPECTPPPSQFEMSHMEPQRVDERALQNYDWSQTSYLPGMLEQVAFSGPTRTVPKLIFEDYDCTDAADRANYGYISENDIQMDRRDFEPKAHIVSVAVCGEHNAEKNVHSQEFFDIDETLCDLFDEEYPKIPKAPPTPQPPQTSLDLCAMPKPTKKRGKKKDKKKKKKKQEN